MEALQAEKAALEEEVAQLQAAARAGELARQENARLRALLEGSPTVAEATADLGLLYRNICQNRAHLTLKKELEITRQYLDLMCFLYDDQFLYHCDIPEDMYAISTPKIWMQPIVENFF